MVTVLGVLGVLAVLFVAGVVATREGPVLVDAPADRADLALPAGRVSGDDLERVRFGLALRGYRMSEVDEVLDRVGAELRRRDELIARLLALAEGAPGADGVDGAEEPGAEPSEQDGEARGRRLSP